MIHYSVYKMSEHNDKKKKMPIASSHNQMFKCLSGKLLNSILTKWIIRSIVHLYSSVSCQISTYLLLFFILVPVLLICVSMYCFNTSYKALWIVFEYDMYKLVMCYLTCWNVYFLSFLQVWIYGFWNNTRGICIVGSFEQTLYRGFLSCWRIHQS